MTQSIAGIALASIFGAVIGSFLNVCIYRLPIGRSIVWPASACPSCGRELAWYENVPIISWLVLRGRCRTCCERISVRYPIIELLTAVMCATAFWYWADTALRVAIHLRVRADRAFRHRP